MRYFSILISLALTAWAVTASAESTTNQCVLDFEGIDNSQLASGSLMFQDVDGTGIDVRIEGPALTLVDLYEFAGDKEWTGNAIITNIWPQNDGISVSFSRPVTLVGIGAGDFGSDDDGPLKLRAFDCAGGVLDEASAPWTADRYPPFARLEVRGDGICQVLFTSGGDYAGSAFLDDLVFVPTPRKPTAEPSSTISTSRPGDAP